MTPTYWSRDRVCVSIRTWRMDRMRCRCPGCGWEGCELAPASLSAVQFHARRTQRTSHCPDSVLLPTRPVPPHRRQRRLRQPLHSCLPSCKGSGRFHPSTASHCRHLTTMHTADQTPNRLCGLKNRRSNMAKNLTDTANFRQRRLWCSKF